MADLVYLTGAVESIIYQNKENGYTVLTVVPEGETEEVVVRGTLPEVLPGETLKITGSYRVHPVYGTQLEAEFYEKSMPATLEGMEKYLASGVIKGIGAKTAGRIIKKFGEAAFFVIEEKPERLAEIRGITFEKAMKINAAFAGQAKLRQAMVFLQSYGVSPAYAMKIYKRYREKTIDTVKTNPYRLAEDVTGIGFKMADRIAAAAGMDAASPHRIKAGIKYILASEAGNGHVFMPRELLIEEAARLLDVSPEAEENALLELILNHQAVQDRIDGADVVYLNFYFQAESYTARKLLEIGGALNSSEGQSIASEISAAEAGAGIVLAENQREAVAAAAGKGLLVITGGPGTGKTTIINAIIKIFSGRGMDVILAAPTGRAAKRMTEATGMKAQTIHRLLGISFLEGEGHRQSFDHDEDNPLEADAIIIDETSMVDILLMQSLLKAVRPGTRLVLVGDVDQLPSVGAGNVLKDIIRSECLTVVRLNEVFRQARESAIVMNAHRINNGEEPVLNDRERDFFFLRRAYAEEAAAAMIQLVTKRLPDFYGFDPMTDIQVLTPMRKSPLGVENLNIVLQRALNPPEPGKREMEFRSMLFREGDKVMQVKNNYNIQWKIYQNGYVTEDGTGVFNGDMGLITRIDKEAETMTVAFDDGKVVEYDFTQAEELEQSYAVTIHKSQGSEYPVVVIPVLNGPPMLMTRNLLYTAVTRARKLVVLVGLKETITRMIENDREVSRYSGLTHRLRVLREFLSEAEEG